MMMMMSLSSQGCCRRKMLSKCFHVGHGPAAISGIDVVRLQASPFSTTSLGEPSVNVEHTKTRRRRRGSTRLSNTKDIPSYKEFVHRFTVLSLYRNFLKEIRSLPHNQTDLREQVQREFRSNKAVNDPFNVQRALAEGKRRFQELQEFTGNDRKYDGDSWLNTKDTDDPRGRVGTGWPWDRSE